MYSRLGLLILLTGPSASIAATSAQSSESACPTGPIPITPPEPWRVCIDPDNYVPGAVSRITNVQAGDSFWIAVNYDESLPPGLDHGVLRTPEPIISNDCGTGTVYNAGDIVEVSLPSTAPLPTCSPLIEDEGALSQVWTNQTTISQIHHVETNNTDQDHYEPVSHVSLCSVSNAGCGVPGCGVGVFFYDFALAQGGASLKSNATAMYDTPFLTAFTDIEVNDLDVVLLACRLFFPGEGKKTALIRYDVDTQPPMDFTDQILLMKGDDLLGFEVTAIGRTPNCIALNNNKTYLFSAQREMGGNPNPCGLFLKQNSFPYVLLAEQGQALPAGGDTYFAFKQVDLNDSGQYAFVSTLNSSSSTEQAIVAGETETVWYMTGPVQLVSNRVIQRTGASVTDLSGSARTVIDYRSGNIPIFITRRGDVFWWARLDGDITTDEAVFVNGRMIAQKGVTVSDFAESRQSFSVSPSGRHVLFIEDSPTPGTVRMDLGDVFRIPPCNPSGGSLDFQLGSDGFPAIGEPLRLRAESTDPNCQLYRLLWRADIDLFAGCGAEATESLVLACGGFPPLDYLLGEVLIDPSAIIQSDPPFPSDCLGAACGADYSVLFEGLSPGIPHDISLLGMEIYAQAEYLNYDGPTDTYYATYSDALRFVISEIP